VPGADLVPHPDPDGTSTLALTVKTSDEPSPSIALLPPALITTTFTETSNLAPTLPLTQTKSNDYHSLAVTNKSKHTPVVTENPAPIISSDIPANTIVSQILTTSAITVNYAGTIITIHSVGATITNLPTKPTDAIFSSPPTQKGTSSSGSALNPAAQ